MGLAPLERLQFQMLCLLLSVLQKTKSIGYTCVLLIYTFVCVCERDLLIY